MRATLTCWPGGVRRARGRLSLWADSGHRGAAQWIRGAVRPSDASPPWSRWGRGRRAESAEPRLKFLSLLRWTGTTDKEHVLSYSQTILAFCLSFLQFTFQVHISVFANFYRLHKLWLDNTEVSLFVTPQKLNWIRDVGETENEGNREK